MGTGALQLSSDPAVSVPKIRRTQTDWLLEFKVPQSLHREWTD